MAREEQSGRHTSDVWVEKLQPALDDMAARYRLTLNERDLPLVTLHRLLTKEVGIESGKISKLDELRAVDILHELGWHKPIQRRWVQAEIDEHEAQIQATAHDPVPHTMPKNPAIKWFPGEYHPPEEEKKVRRKGSKPRSRPTPKVDGSDPLRPPD